MTDRLSETDSPEVAAAIERLTGTLNGQAVMAVLGLAVVTAVMAFTSDHEGGAPAILLELAPWFVGLSIVILLANRWTLSLKAKQIRRNAADGAALRKSR